MCGCLRHRNCRAMCECNCQHTATECDERAWHPFKRHVWENSPKPEEGDQLELMG